MRMEAVAGQFYPASKDMLIEQIEKCFLNPLGPEKRSPTYADKKPRDIVGAVVPHAGYIYSGYEAAHVYYSLIEQEKPELVVLLGPSHRGYGSTVSVSGEDWRTPLGVVKCDKTMAEKLFRKCEIVTLDEIAHRYEHSIEVQLPFLQYIYGDFKFIAITLNLQTIEIARELGKCIAELDKDVLFIASSDFTHYESADVARNKDLNAIEAILEMDEEEFMERIYRNNVTACGYGAIATAIVAGKALGAKKAELLKYGNSGDITGDYSEIVAYAGIVFRR
ncbi:hypothetical protein IPdc08_01922 [archaeon]|nr:hypothetical protein IPdc08_01922 [archaeon]